MGYSTIISGNLKHLSPSSVALTIMLCNNDRTLSESEDSTIIVDSESESGYYDSEPTNVEPFNDHLCESVSKAKLSNHEEKATIVDAMIKI